MPDTDQNADAATRMLVVDDDEIFRNRLMRALNNRGLSTVGAGDAAEAERVAREQKPHWASVDLRMPGRGGLELVRRLHQMDPEMLVVVLTGYGTISTAVEAVRAGAADYLTKPVDTDQILASFERAAEDDVGPTDADGTPGHGSHPPLDGIPQVSPAEAQTPSLARVEWDYIHRVLSDCGGNISQAARKLGIHRRSLQRKLQKLPPLE